jgi:hypothetical protein
VRQRSNHYHLYHNPFQTCLVEVLSVSLIRTAEVYEVVWISLRGQQRCIMCVFLNKKTQTSCERGSPSNNAALLCLSREKFL